MLPLPDGGETDSGVGAPEYGRHRPEPTTLLLLVRECDLALKVRLGGQGTALPAHVEREFERQIPRAGCTGQVG